MFGPNHYVPILKSKDAEFQAIKGLDPKVKKSISVVLEVTHPSEKKTWQQQLDAVFNKAFSAFGNEIFFVDGRWIDDPSSITSMHPLEYLFSQFRNNGGNAVPVTGLYRDPSYQQAVQKIVSIDKRGLLLRLEGNSLANLPQADLDIANLINNLGITIRDVDVIIDFRSISQGQHIYLSHTFSYILNSLTSIQLSRSLTLSASAFPYDLSDISSNSVEDIERTEWKLWEMLYQSRTSIQQLPSFSDYAIAHPELPTPIPFTNRSAQIRYTLNDEWRIFKGYGVLTQGKGGSQQTIQLSKDLVASGIFYGRSFSEGDAFIEDCANGKTGAGNGTTWRKVGTSHHINVVINQLSNLSWP